MRAPKAEGVLLSGPVTENRIREAARVAREECAPISDIRATGSYRKEIVEVLTRRAFSEIIHSARGEKEK